MTVCGATSDPPPRIDSPSQAARRRMERLRFEPLFVADWRDAVFIHFEADPAALQRQVPFTLDLRDGRAFVSLVAFTMSRFRPAAGGRWTSWFTRPIAEHPFLNVRTYVIHEGEPGIYFLAEWLPNRLAVALGPRTFGLPYRFGRLDYDHDPNSRPVLRGRVEDCCRQSSWAGRQRRCTKRPSDTPRSRSARPRVRSMLASEPRASARAEWPAELRPQSTEPRILDYEARATDDRPPQGCAAGTLDEFLVERYSAFTLRGRSHRRFRVWHPPWPCMPIAVQLNAASLIELTGPWFGHARLVGGHWSPGVEDVWMGRAARVSALRGLKPRDAFQESPFVSGTPDLPAVAAMTGRSWNLRADADMILAETNPRDGFPVDVVPCGGTASA